MYFLTHTQVIVSESKHVFSQDVETTPVHKTKSKKIPTLYTYTNTILSCTGILLLSHKTKSKKIPTRYINTILAYTGILLLSHKTKSKKNTYAIYQHDTCLYRDPSVMSAALCVLYDIAKSNPSAYHNMVPSLVSIIKQVWSLFQCVYAYLHTCTYAFIYIHMHHV